jgi:hypothetical protein
MTVGDLRKLIADLPDDMNVRPQWLPGEEPGDHEPGVEIHGFDVANGELLVRISLFYLDEIDEAPECSTPVYLKLEGQ